MMLSAVHIGKHENMHNNGQQGEVPKCPICMEKLGTHGGPTSLACGHNGCLECLQQVQACYTTPLCPLCRTPFGSEVNLGPNLDLKDALGRLELKWPGEPRFDEDNLREYGTADHQQKEIDVECAEQHYRPCSYEEFNTWTPVATIQKDTVGASRYVCNAWTSERRSAIQAVKNVHPDARAWNLARGMVSMLAKKSPPSVEQDSPQASHHLDTDGLNGGLEDVWASVHLPSAPPLSTGSDESTMVLRSMLEAEPPQWVPDSACNRCMQCNMKFQPLTRGRHHCRFCGGIFCRSCSKGKCLLPFKFKERDPQRVCDSCYERLEPIQGFLTNIISNAAQIAVHDVTDSTCMRGWLNNPIGLCMEDEIYKATNTLRSFCKVGILKPEQSIPEAVLRGAKGLAILTVIKAGMLLTYKVGTGLLVARRDDGSWSPPAAIMSCGLGWGLQVGGELVDFIIVLRSTKAVKAFSGRMHLSIGAGLSASVGPLGRLAEADLRVGEKGAAACYTYSCSQGAFVGVSFEGNVVASRVETNARFYGDVYLTPEYILFGPVPAPRAAAPLHGALHDLFTTVGG